MIVLQSFPLVFVLLIGLAAVALRHALRAAVRLVATGVLLGVVLSIAGVAVVSAAV